MRRSRLGFNSIGSGRNKIVDGLERVEADWSELSELERIAEIQSTFLLSLIDEILAGLKDTV